MRGLNEPIRQQTTIMDCLSNVGNLHSSSLASGSSMSVHSIRDKTPPCCKSLGENMHNSLLASISNEFPNWDLVQLVKKKGVLTFRRCSFPPELRVQTRKCLVKRKHCLSPSFFRDREPRRTLLSFPRSTDGSWIREPAEQEGHRITLHFIKLTLSCGAVFTKLLQEHKTDVEKIAFLKTSLHMYSVCAPGRAMSGKNNGGDH